MRRYKKSYRTKKKRSFKLLKSKFFWLGCFIVVLCLSLSYFLLFSSFFQVKNIEVLGTEKVSPQEIHNIVFQNTKNIFLTDFGTMKEIILSQYPQIGVIIFKRKLPDQILVQIEERKPAAVSYPKSFLMGFSRKEYFLIDEQGIVFEKTSETPLDLPLIELNSSFPFQLGQQAVKKEELDKVLSIDSHLNDLGIEVAKNTLVSERRVNVETSEAWMIYFNLKDDLDWQIEKLSVLLEQRIPPEKRRNLEYIDLRFEKIFIFPDTYLKD